eukprot:9849590-Lingulodinium_polyedra.AAC.1
MDPSLGPLHGRPSHVPGPSPVRRHSSLSTPLHSLPLRVPNLGSVGWHSSLGTLRRSRLQCACNIHVWTRM